MTTSCRPKTVLWNFSAPFCANKRSVKTAARSRWIDKRFYVLRWRQTRHSTGGATAQSSDNPACLQSARSHLRLHSTGVPTGEGVLDILSYAGWWWQGGGSYYEILVSIWMMKRWSLWRWLAGGSRQCSKCLHPWIWPRPRPAVACIEVPKLSESIQRRTENDNNGTNRGRRFVYWLWYYNNSIRTCQWLQKEPEQTINVSKIRTK